MAKVDVKELGGGEFEVTVVDGGRTTTHLVLVPEGFAAGAGVPEVGGDRLVRESFAFLLEREPAASILRRFELPVIARYFGDYHKELRRRLGSA